MTNHLTSMTWRGYALALVAMGSSVAGAVVVAVIFNDFICCIAISIGILANGLATSVYGYGTLLLSTHPTIPKAVDGDGAFVGNNTVVIVKGPEHQIAKITRGRYKLRYGEPSYNLIGWISLALFAQAISQLILLLAATLNGQIIFLATFLVSWIYNAYLASEDRDKLQFDVLEKKLQFVEQNKLEQQFFFERWASIAAASAFYLKPSDTDAWLRHFIPNHTKIWEIWRKQISEAVAKYYSEPETDNIEFKVQDDTELNAEDVSRLSTHLLDASKGYNWIRTVKTMNKRPEVDGKNATAT